MEPNTQPTFAGRSGPFTDRSRKLYQLAVQEARRLDDDHIRPEHLLLGLALDGSGVAAHVLRHLDLNMRDVRQAIEKILRKESTSRSIEELPETLETRIVIESAMDAAKSLKHNYVGTEHILLGLLHEQSGVAGQVLRDLGITWELARTSIVAILGEVL